MDYFSLLDHVHRNYRPRGYLEVGVSQGQSLTLVLDGTRAVGVDPAPRVCHPLSAGTTVEAVTSDEFFAEHAKEVLGDTPIDVAFIDGMHLFEFALRDFLNIERLAHDETVVLIHDCLPNRAIEAERNRSSRLWTGDVWKLLFFLEQRRPHLKVVAVDAPPTGLIVVSGFSDRGHRDDSEVTSGIDAYANLQYSDYEHFRDAHLTIVAGELESIRSSFPDQPWQPITDINALVAAREARTLDTPLTRRILESRALHDAKMAPTVFVNWLKYRLR